MAKNGAHSNSKSDLHFRSACGTRSRRSMNFCIFDQNSNGNQKKRDTASVLHVTMSVDWSQPYWPGSQSIAFTIFTTHTHTHWHTIEFCRSMNDDTCHCEYSEWLIVCVCAPSGVHCYYLVKMNEYDKDAALHWKFKVPSICRVS